MTTPAAADTIAGWSFTRYSRISRWPSLVAGLLSIVLILFRTQAIFFWTVLLVFYVWLGVAATHRGAKEFQLITLGWLTGVPLGFVLALAQIITFHTGATVLNLIRLPVIVSLFGMVIASATGFARTKHVTTKHLVMGDPHPPKRTPT